jgi:short subunit dehydrogenase-like uncharacterized protein
MIYGATGYTGKLMAEEAVKRELSPILAGRSETKLQPLAVQLGLEYSAFPLDSLDTVIKALQSAKVELVLHVAGPFIFTSDIMIRACLAVGAHYLDITGEIPVYQNAYSYHQQALDKQIVIMPGVGFDVVPSDCLLKYVADQVDEATQLEVAFHTHDIVVSRGTLKSGIEIIRTVGNLVRRNDELVKVPFASETRTFRFISGEAFAVQNMWGDVVTAYQTTGVPNITTYFVYSQASEWQLRFLYRLAPLLNIGFIRRWFQRQIDKMPLGPSPEQQQTAHVDIYAKASNARGESAEAWLETCEAYRFTALASLRAVELVLDGHYSGAMTPAGAFGADFVLEMAGTKRLDNL